MTADDNPLSMREQEILSLVARGLTNQEIARELVISPNTVKVHLRNIFAKVEATSRTEAIVRAAQAGWITVSGLEGAEEEEADLAVQPLVPSLASWQRVYFIAAALLVVAALLAPGLSTRLQAAVPTSDISDRGLFTLGAPPRAEVGRWNPLAPLPVARSRLALATAGDQLFAIGGETEEGITAAVDVYDPQTNGWLPRGDIPLAVSNVQAGNLNGLIYVPGGTTPDGVVSAKLEIYDPTADAWSTGQPLPMSLAAYALAVHQGRLYLFGGWNGTEYLDTTLTYDPDDDAWETRSPLPEAVGFAAAASLGDRIIVAGGYDGRQESATCSIYHPDDDRWETCASMTLPRGGLGMAVDGNSVYVIGGGWQSAMTFNERYDSLSDTWSSFSSPIQGQWRNLGVADLGSVVYAVGGWSGDYLDANEAFLGIFRAFLPLGARSE